MIVAQISMNRVTSISTSLRTSEKELKATYRFRAYWALGPTHDGSGHSFLSLRVGLGAKSAYF